MPRSGEQPETLITGFTFVVDGHPEWVRKFLDVLAPVWEEMYSEGAKRAEEILTEQEKLTGHGPRVALQPLLPCTASFEFRRKEVADAPSG